MGKITQAEINDLKAALKELQGLQNDLGKSSSAVQYMGDVQPVAGAIKGLIDNSGTKVSQYIDARSTAIRTALSNATAGVATAIGLLSTTITNYETNEKTHKDAADKTGNNGGGSSANGRGKGGT